MWCKFVIVYFAVTFAIINCSDVEEERIDEDVRVIDTEKWRAMDNRPQPGGDWVPAEGLLPTEDQPLDLEPVMKRRRVRKRKRRPQNFEREYQEDESYPDRPLRRFRRPQRPENLDQRDQWRDEMMSEEPFRPVRGYKRRRLYPKYDETPQGNEENNEEIVVTGTQIRVVDEPEVPNISVVQDESKSPILVVEKIRDPHTPLREDNRKIHYTREKLRDPIVRVQEISDEPLPEQIKSVEVSTTHAPIDLKAILKQAGGISLSELLQQKNLSLADLLKGEQHAISALTKLQEQTTKTDPQTINVPLSEPIEQPKPKRYNGYRRIPANLNRNKQDVVDNTEFESTKDNVENERKTTSPYVRKENKYFTDYKIQDFTTEVTTERRIFVPSHPKYYTSVNFKPDTKELNIHNTTLGIRTSTPPAVIVNDDDNSVETTAFPTTLTTKSATVNFKFTNRRNTLPPTLAKLRNLYAKTTTTTTTTTTRKPIIRETETENYPKFPFVPEKAIKININELYGLSNIFNKHKPTEGPLKISVNIQEMDNISNEDIGSEDIIPTTENKSEIILKETGTVENTDDPEKLKPTSAKQEIQEILSDEISRENLLNVLEARNMTLTELLEQRERGSSQKHLADIFHNQTREPEPQEELIVDHIVKTKVPDKNNFLERSSFEPQPLITVNSETKYPMKNLKLDFLSPIDDSLSNTRESRQNQYLNRKHTDDYNIINNPLFRTDTKKTNEVINKLIPVWRQAYTNMQRNQQDITNNLMQDDTLLKDEAQRVEDIENQIADAVNGALNEVDAISNKISEEDESYLQLPYGVRSAVIASATIVGISLCVFVTIFVIFKWTQKKHKRLSYSNSLSSLKIRSPILETQYQKRIFGSLMDSTLGRNKQISTISGSEPQSLQDYLWENDRKPFQ